FWLTIELWSTAEKLFAGFLLYPHLPKFASRHLTVNQQVTLARLLHTQTTRRARVGSTQHPPRRNLCTTLIARIWSQLTENTHKNIRENIWVSILRNIRESTWVSTRRNIRESTRASTNRNTWVKTRANTPARAASIPANSDKNLRLMA